VYALSAPLRDALEQTGPVTLSLDLAPDRSEEALARSLSRALPGESLANRLRKRAGIDGVKAALVRETLGPDALSDPHRLAAGVKALPLAPSATRPIDEAISSAGGVRFEALDARLMLQALPGVFCAGEMLDWEAPTGGYLLTACMSSGRWAGHGALAWLAATPVSGSADS
jgi:predicted flavoprotein YhiN